MKFLTRAYSSDGDWNADCDYVLLEVDAESARTILARARAFDELGKREGEYVGSALLEMVFFDRSATFLRAADVPESLAEEADHHDFVQVDAAFDPGSGERTECDQMVISARGVHWTSIPKHSDIYVSSEALPWSCIERVLNPADDGAPPLEPSPR